MRPILEDEQELSQRLAPVILGADFCAYAYIRCFWEAYRIKPLELATSDVKSISRSRFVDYRVVEGLDQEEVFLSTLSELGRELVAKDKVPLLVGCGDFYARMASKHKPLLEEWYYVAYIDFDLLDNITQKENFYTICDEIGIPYPRTRYLDCSDTQAKADDSGFSYPLIAKPSNSALYHYAHIPNQKKVFEVQNYEELSEIYSNLQKSSYDKSLILQEFIPGDDSEIRILSCYTDADSDPVFMIGGQVVLEDHSPTAIGNPAVIIPDHNQKLLDDAARFMKHVGYHGMANFDAKYDARDDSYKFFEINTRPGRSSMFVHQAGVNFAQVQVEDVVLGKKPAYREALKPFVYTTVPPAVIKRSITDAALQKQVLDGFKNHTTNFALAWDADSFAQKFWSSITYYHQISKFKKYLWNTDGKQADVS